MYRESMDKAAFFSKSQISIIELLTSKQFSCFLPRISPISIITSILTETSLYRQSIADLRENPKVTKGKIPRKGAYLVNLPIGPKPIMLVEPSPSALTYCSACQTLIPKGHLRVTLKPFSHYCRKQGKMYSHYYHLRCYRPKLPAPISQKEVLFKGVDVKGLEQVTKWVDGWNKQFVAEEVPEKYTKMAVLPVAVARPRLLLEVFGYLAVREIEQSAAFTCKEWYFVSRNDDLWKSMYIRQFHPTETQANASYRSAFILNRLNSCWHCNSPLLPHQIHLKCPYHDLLLCKKCSRLPACKVITLNSYIKTLNIAKSTADLLHLPVFLQNKVQSCYVEMVAERLFEYAEVRRNRLIQHLEDREVSLEAIMELRSFNLKRFYMQKIRAKSGILQELVRFCGKNEAPDKFDQQVAKVASRLGCSNSH